MGWRMLVLGIEALAVLSKRVPRINSGFKRITLTAVLRRVFGRHRRPAGNQRQ